MNDSAKSPLLIGLRAAKANLVPGLILQAAMAALVAAYYWAPATKPWFAILAQMKQLGGYPFSTCASAIAGSLLPEIFVVFFFQQGKFSRENINNLLFGAALWGFDGFCVDAFYRGQAWWFGNGVDFATITKKVLVDQFLFTAFWTTPFAMACYEWKNQGYSFKGMSRVFTQAFFMEKTFPAVVAAWGVWIPLVCIIYALPLLLQVPLFLLALTFWVLILTFIANAQNKQQAQIPLGASPLPEV